MTIDFLQTILGAFIASIIWFLFSWLFQINPLVLKIYKKFEKSPAIKLWNNKSVWVYNYLIIIGECLIFAFVYSFIKPVLQGTVILNGLIFGLILTGIGPVVDIADRWIASTYPNKLLWVELIYGIFGSFVIALVLAFVI